MIGFIGAGNMAAALVGGMVSRGLCPGSEIIVSNPHIEKAQALADRFGVAATACNREAAQNADLLFLCVKPYKMEEVLQEIRPVLPEDVLLVSVAAGKTLAWLNDTLGHPAKWVRIMPNTPARIGEGICAVCALPEAQADPRYERVLQLLSGTGEVLPMEERLVDIAGQVAGASPAWLFMVIEAMADGAVREGMPRDMAYKLAAAGVAGAGKLALQNGGNPGALKDAVTSPGGTTIEGVRVLEERAVRGAFMDAVINACEKAKTL